MRFLEIFDFLESWILEAAHFIQGNFKLDVVICGSKAPLSRTIINILILIVYFAGKYHKGGWKCGAF